MATDEATRLHLYEQARATWGAEAADTLMHALPREPDQIATKADLALLSAELRGEMALLRSELRGEMAELRSEISSTASDNLQKMFFGMVASNATLVGLVFAAVKLG